MTGLGAGDLDTALRTAGLRVTRPRMAVLRWLHDHPGHHPAEVIVDQAGLPKATTYHVLGQLSDAGLVLTAEAGPGRVLYETATDPHHHFVCRACGRILDVPCATGAQPCLDLVVAGAARVDSADVILKGLCADCG